MGTVKNDPTWIDRRSGRDRRSGNDRRMIKNLFLFNGQTEKRSGHERRKPEEDRAGWVRVSEYSSVYLGIPTDKI
ncbi:MAG: hypothetical protein KGY61_06870 [Desulfobacterales bacterium]|nr:hypothetical protein [Desulfobacterales bacterium]